MAAQFDEQLASTSKRTSAYPGELNGMTHQP